MTATATATFLRIEVRRTLRSPRYALFTIGVPVGLFLVLASLYGSGTQDGISGTAWIMVSMSVFGAMAAAVAIGGRIAGERAIGWTRQLRLTALSGRAYVAGKAVTAFLVAVPALALVYAVGAAFEGVRLHASQWAEAAGWSLVALAPFVAMGIWLGQWLTVDVLGAVSGALFTALGILGGHSGASHVRVLVDPHAIEIVDDGHGAAGGQGSGLAGLAERAARLGGRVEAGPVAGGGYRLRVEVPPSAPAAASPPGAPVPTASRPGAGAG